MPQLTYPLALFGLAAVPLLVACYLFRNRFQRRPVSSLLLWRFITRPREGGPRLERLVLPLTFFLELLTVLLIVLSAVDPRWHHAGNRRPLFVVLDNSASMLAGGGSRSPRERAGRELARLYRENGSRTVRCIIAGKEPRLVGSLSARQDPLDEVRRRWHCGSAFAALEEGMRLGREAGGEDVDIVVLTDHAPPAAATGDARTRWLAFGAALPNAGITRATRRTVRGRERVFLQLSSFSSGRTATAVIVDDGKGGELVRRDVRLRPGESRQEVVDVPPGAELLHAWLQTGDALETDNHAWLVSEEPAPVRVLCRIGNAKLGRVFEKALDSSGMRSVLTENPLLVITDEPGLEPAGDLAWTVRLVSPAAARAYAGPFVCDMNHPLMAGTNLTAVIWGGGDQGALPGVPVVTAGNVPLVTDLVSRSGRHDLRFVFAPDLSTLQRTPNLPIMVWNLLRWRASESPGFAAVNVRLGEEAVLIPEPGTDVYQVVSPKGRQLAARTDGGRLAVPADEAGPWQVSGRSGTYRFACNLFSPEESDLTRSVSGGWGSLVDAGMVREEYASTAWLWSVLAVAVLLGHLKLLTRAPGRP